MIQRSSWDGLSKVRSWVTGGASLLLALSLAMNTAAQSADESESTRRQADEARQQAEVAEQQALIIREQAEQARQMAEQQRAAAVLQVQRAAEHSQRLARQLAEQQQAFDAQRSAYTNALAKMEAAARRAGVDERRLEALKQAQQQLEEIQAQRADSEMLRRIEDANQLKPQEFRVFKLRHITPHDSAMVLKNLLGEGGPRIAVDQRSNMLLIAGTEDQLEVVARIIESIDEASSDSKEPASEPASAESLQLRILWLLDSVEGMAPTSKLVHPQVLDALQQLGFESPAVVCQQTSALTLTDKDRRGEFQFEVPVVINGQLWRLSGSGTVSPSTGDQYAVTLGLDVGIANHVDGAENLGSELQGSILSPLGHHTVVGTSAFVDATGGKQSLQQHLSAFVVYLDRSPEFPAESPVRDSGK